MASGQFFDDDITHAVQFARVRAIADTLKAGVPVSYRDTGRNLDIMEALSVDADAEVSRHRALTSAVTNSLADKFTKRKEQKLAVLRHANDIARGLRDQAENSLRRSFQEIERTVADIGPADSFVQTGGSDRGNGHWYKFEVITSAKEAGKFANFSEDHYFTKASVGANEKGLCLLIRFTMWDGS